jgi:hypothetical protein
MKLINFFLVKSLQFKTVKIFPNKFLETAFYGLDTEPELEPELVKSRNRNRNLSKFGTRTGTVKNSYGSATLTKTLHNAIPPSGNERLFLYDTFYV